MVKCPPLIEVPGGIFTMGDDAGLPDQRPAHRVHVRSFRMAVHPVTRAQYQRFCKATGMAFPPRWSSPLLADPRQPAVGVNWFESVAYTQWLTDATGLPFRLPTEAERERATRGLIGGRRYPWGPTAAPDGGAAPMLAAPPRVDRCAANPLGILGLADGVHEWCLDWYDAHWYARSGTYDPRGPSSGTRRVSRGGSWRHATSTTPCAARSSLPPELHYTDYGFRIILDAPDVSEEACCVD